jgi:hypothetical protein
MHVHLEHADNMSATTFCVVTLLLRNGSEVSEKGGMEQENAMVQIRGVLEPLLQLNKF